MTIEEYRKAEDERIQRVLDYMEAGVLFQDIHSAYIAEGVEIGAGTWIGACVSLEEGTKIGQDCKIYPNTRIYQSTIGNGVTIESSVVLESSIDDKTKVGPFAYVRPNSKIGKECKVGDFVEVKNSTFGDGSKSSHLTYIGDSDIGKNVNLGCGVVFVNYDGSNKHRSTLGDGVFVGCNSNMISPVEIGDGAYIAAGSTVTEDVPEDALCIARSRQTNIEGWAARRGLYNKK